MHMLQEIEAVPVTMQNSSRSEVADEVLVKQFYASQDHEAFTELVQRYKDSAFRIAFARSGNRDLAEDAVQDAFFELARKRHMNPPDQFRTWFLAVVSNMTRHRMRSEHRSIRRVQSARYKEEARIVAAKRSEASAEATLNSETHRALTEALENLHEDLRLPLVLYFVEGMTQDEVGAVVGVSQPLIARRIAQGLEKLRARLALSGVAVTAAALPALLEHTEFLRASGALSQALSSASFLKRALEAGSESIRRPGVAAPWGAKIVAGVLLTACAGALALVYLREKAPEDDRSSPTPVVAKTTAQRTYKKWTWDLTQKPPPDDWIHDQGMAWSENEGFHTTTQEKSTWIVSPVHLHPPLKVTLFARSGEVVRSSEGAEWADSDNLLKQRFWRIIPYTPMGSHVEFATTVYAFDHYIALLVPGGQLSMLAKYENESRATRLALSTSNLSIRRVEIEEIRNEDVPATLRSACDEVASKQEPTQVVEERPIVYAAPGVPLPEYFQRRLHAPLIEDPAP